MPSNGILRFTANKPERIALAATPEETESVFGGKPDWKCQLVDGRLVYLKQAVKAQLDEMGIRLHEPVEVTQTMAQHGAKKIYSWKVRRVEEEREQRPANHENGTPAAATTTTEPQASQSQRTSYTKIMASCWIASIDALIMARDYAKSQDLEFRITDESLRCCANSIFIAYDRRHNGGAR